MSTLTLHTGLSWTGSHEEDVRFRRILLQTLLLCLVAGVITPYIRLPQPELAEELPARRVRLLAEQPPRPVPKQTPAPAPQPVPVAPTVSSPQEPQAVPQPVPLPAPVVTPRQKAASSGVLAMSDALAELQGMVPKNGAETGQETAAAQVNTSPQPSMLTANVTRGSQGIRGGVAHESVLGAAQLPERVESGPGGSSRGGRVAVRGRTAAPPSGAVRSEEAIQEVLDRNKGAMYTLYNRELRKDGTLQGKLVLSITISPAGKVTRCTILSSELGSASLEQQLVALIKRIDFGNKPGVAAVTTKIPIEFFPR
jgi:periplasmic protein TonB